MRADSASVTPMKVLVVMLVSQKQFHAIAPANERRLTREMCKLKAVRAEAPLCTHDHKNSAMGILKRLESNSMRPDLSARSTIYLN